MGLTSPNRLIGQVLMGSYVFVAQPWECWEAPMRANAHWGRDVSNYPGALQDFRRSYLVFPGVQIAAHRKSEGSASQGTLLESVRWKTMTAPSPIFQDG